MTLYSDIAGSNYEGKLVKHYTDSESRCCMLLVVMLHAHAQMRRVQLALSIVQCAWLLHVELHISEGVAYEVMPDVCTKTPGVQSSKTEDCVRSTAVNHSQATLLTFRRGASSSSPTVTCIVDKCYSTTAKGFKVLGADSISGRQIAHKSSLKNLLMGLGGRKLRGRA